MSLNILLASTSKVYGTSYLSYLSDEIQQLFKDSDEVLFIPFARPGGISYSEYTKKAKMFFQSIDKDCVSITSFHKPEKAIEKADAIFTGGGNTFLLLKTLYELKLINPLRDKLEQACPYLGTSAGSNICGQHIKTTNDMPIVYPPSFDALGLVPYVINPHFIDKQEGEKHQGESRSTRLNEYLTQNKIPVVALPEGSWIRVNQGQHKLEGEQTALLFRLDTTREIRPGTDILQVIKSSKTSPE